MKQIARCCLALFLLALPTQRAMGAAPARPQPAAGEIVKIPLHDTLQPVSAASLKSDMEHAARPGVRAIVIDLSTPGGIPASADDMVAAMRASPLPVVVWVSMPGTRVSGEGLRLLAEADVALMAPGSWLTPLWTERARGITPRAQADGSEQLLAALSASQATHGRSDDIAANLSRGTHWFSAAEAVEAQFVDGTAKSEGDLLRFLQGRTIVRHGANVKLNTLNAKITVTGTTSQKLLLLTLMNPDLAVLLVMLGMLLIYLEVNTPGTIVPGAAGLLLVLLASFALHLLPLRPSALLLCALAVGLLLLESRFPRSGLFAATGVVTLVFGLAGLVRGPIPELEVGWGTAIGAGLGFGGVTACLIVLAIEARRAKFKTGADAMLGWLAVAQTALAPEGQVLVRGELWKARLTSGDTSVEAGGRVKVLRAEGTVLEVASVPLSQNT